MLRFDSDYMEICHPAILQRLSEICLDKYPGYGEDDCCASAADKIRAACGMPQAQVTLYGRGDPDQRHRHRRPAAPL
jgi:threonine aldolase